MASEKEPGQRAHDLWCAGHSMFPDWGEAGPEERAAWAKLEREIARQAQEEMRERCAAAVERHVGFESYSEMIRALEVP